MSNNRGSALVMAILCSMLMGGLGIVIVGITMESVKMSQFFGQLDNAYGVANHGMERIAFQLDKDVAVLSEEARLQVTNEFNAAMQSDPLKYKDGSGLLLDTFYSDFKTRYSEVFKQKLNTKYSSIATLDQRKALLGSLTEEDGIPYVTVDGNARIYLSSTSFDATNFLVRAVILGKYADYKKTLNVSYDLIPQETEIPYNVANSSVVGTYKEKPDMLTKAVVAQKNVISVANNVNINGDVLAFGSIPQVSGTEDMNATYDRYGGIVVGMHPDFYNRAATFGFNATKLPSTKSASLSITGDAATLGYLHILQSQQSLPSSVRIVKDTYARAVRIERYAHYSQFLFDGKVNVMDNFQIDSNKSEARLNSELRAFVDFGGMLDGSGWGNTNPLDMTTPKRTSAITLNGDSKLALNGAVYVGGSTFLDSTEPYMTGISMLKGTSKIARAYLKDDTSNPTNNLYYDTGSDFAPTAAAYKTYTFSFGNESLMNGRASSPGVFSLRDRADHFKGVWEKLWKPNPLYENFINPDNITISEGPNGTLPGFSWGSIIANGKVYTIKQMSADSNYFKTEIQMPTIKNYFNEMKLFLTDVYDPERPKLAYVSPQKSVTDATDPSFLGAGKIALNTAYIPVDPTLNQAVPSRGFVYYSNGDLDISWVSGKMRINNIEMPIYNGVTKGIIFCQGNVYINEGVNFTGSIIATGNVIFLGGANITYSDAVIADLLMQNSRGDYKINGLFKMLSYTNADQPVKTQRILKRFISIDSWKEVGG